MAARRLIIVLLVLLVASSVAAALVPIERSLVDDETTSSTTSAEPGPKGELLREAIDASGEPETIRMRVGDQLELSVRFQRADEVSIARVGLLEPVDPDAAARFDLVPTEPGSYPVRLLGAQSTVATIEVEPARTTKDRPRQSGESGQGREDRGARQSGGEPGRERDRDRPAPDAVTA